MDEGVAAAERDRAGEDQCSCCRRIVTPSFAWLPIGSLVITILTFTVTYSIAVSRHDAEPFLPYISDTGTRPPESCIFTLGLSFLAIAVAGIMYVRYKVVEATGQTTRKLNKWSLCLGFPANLGLLLVGSFQETNVVTAHIIGAMLAFGAGALYCLMQTIITYRQRSSGCRQSILWIRATASAVAAAAAAISIAMRFVAVSISSTSHRDQQWKSSDAGYAEHLTSTFCEWIAGAALQAFIMTFINEFSMLSHSYWKMSEPARRPGLDSGDATVEPFLPATDAAAEVLHS